jgi:hypothetical protein
MILKITLRRSQGCVEDHRAWRGMVLLDYGAFPRSASLHLRAASLHLRAEHLICFSPALRSAPCDSVFLSTIACNNAEIKASTRTEKQDTNLVNHF